MSIQHTVAALFDRFSQLRVLVVGDVMIDAYLWGKSSRLSPEAPVPIVNRIKMEQRLGGAANVALNIQSLGATPLLCSVVGDDLEGAALLRLLQEQGQTQEGIVLSPERPTTVKQRIISGGQQLLRIDSEVETDLTPFERKALVQRFRHLLPQADVVIFEDYDKGVLSAEVIRELLSLAQEAAVPTVVDPKKKNFLSYKGSTLFKPNLKELKEGLKVDFADANHEAFEHAVTALQEQMALENVLVTLSERGVFCQSATQEKTYLDAHIRSISDVSGAGDTVVSIAALSLAAGLPLPALAELANLGGGLVCEHVGVVPIDREQLQQEAQNSLVLQRELAVFEVKV
ncbi:bifunctional heptose 7-phosphate kinase/heptose 1-phosphate adenyltransferase [Rufibacter glacialis]|uniref:Bifunctional heptose 7-phosphate kinase/heptose 1-phosphate adenyltransferase n=1 Tax=Rufibacter glacialis TaxID=1259555 RepID=A0A5M8QN78_9BACT|nr:bifunctional ADP-heptose synthase [Rufibacter glacialis]KAA6437677.1 D-glycero-beta-D-manno-heptose-7-phosphate kinase [Rufibacter glacialis]GGK57293.1 carbohydrate kinase [Rufibacter glacialis]